MEHAVLRPTLRGLLTAAALVILPTLAGAQTVSMSASSASFAKSDAILGTGSALDRLLVQQGARPAPREPAAFMTSFASAAARPSADLLVPAIARGPVSADRPDVFNSVALAIGWTPLEARWSRVESVIAGPFWWREFETARCLRCGLIRPQTSNWRNTGRRRAV